MILCIMRTGRRVRNRIADNCGVTLVELVVVISIMAVMVGLMSLGIGIMFTRDASYVAVRIDDELAETRMMSMSKSGVFIFELCIDDSDPYTGSEITIYNATYNDAGEISPEASWTKYKKTLLDKSVKITVSDGGSYSKTSGKIRIIFDKAKGSVKSFDGSSGAGKAFTFTVTSQKNTSKTQTVTLVGNTGRHYTEK